MKSRVKRNKKITSVLAVWMAVIMAAVLTEGSIETPAQGLHIAENETGGNNETLTQTEPEVGSLYALSACLLDADSGRVLYEKDGDTLRANASTTKIMTCILALEYGNLDDLVTVSKYAAGMPDVQLNIREGEQYRLGDLLYSLMLESHNDVAVAIAEHIGGDVKTFAGMMNQKARELGCYDTYFITPNGLDATETVDGKEKFHGTTATDLSRIMAYCIKNEEFLKITRTSSYSFSEKKTGQRSFTVNNKNAFLTMMDGALSGKTGFTGKAGYCYVGALERNGKTFVVALLGCGWPNNKNYKWSDTKKLMNYGLENYEERDLFDYDLETGYVTVKDGATKPGQRENIIEDISLKTYMDEEALTMLVGDWEQVEVKYTVERELMAPVYDRQVVGNVQYYLQGKLIKEYPVYVDGSVEKPDYEWYLLSVVKKFFMAE